MYHFVSSNMYKYFFPLKNFPFFFNIKQVTPQKVIFLSLWLVKYDVFINIRVSITI